MNPLPYLLAWFSGLPSQKWIWPSTMKYRSPSFSYTLRTPLLSDRLKIEAEVFGGILRVGEKQGAIVEIDHAPVMGGHDFFEVGLSELALPVAQSFAELVEVELHGALGIDPDHRRELCDRDIGLGPHDLGNRIAILIVHDGASAHVRRCVVGFEVCGHLYTSFGAWRPKPAMRRSNRCLDASKASSNRITRCPGWDHRGWRWRAAVMLSGVHWSRYPCRVSLFPAPCSVSLTRIPNMSTVYRRSRKKSLSPAPTTLGVV